MTLLETILITWFSGGLLVSLLIGARGVAHDVWSRSTGRRLSTPQVTSGDRRGPGASD